MSQYGSMGYVSFFSDCQDVKKKMKRNIGTPEVRTNLNARDRHGIKEILRKDPAFIKGRKKMKTVEPRKGKVVKVPLNMIVPAKPDTGWLKPNHDVYKCLMCDFGVFDVHNRKMDKCPHCGFEMVQVDAIGLLEIDRKYCIMTEPN